MTYFPGGVVYFHDEKNSWNIPNWHMYPLRVDPGIHLRKAFGAMNPLSPLTCILCGGVITPEDEINEEHLIPKWLMRLTRTEDDASIELLKNTKHNVSRKKTTFASHTNCNTQFGLKIETPGSQAVRRLVSGQPLSNKNTIELLNWMDKLRITYALSAASANGMMKRAWYGIENYPHLRIGRSDRILYVFKSDFSEDNNLHIFDFDDFNYLTTPSCYGIRIFDYFFISVSDVDILSKTFGLPTLHRVTSAGTALISRKTGVRKGSFQDRPIGLKDALLICQPIKPYLGARDIGNHSYALHQNGYGKVFVFCDGNEFELTGGKVDFDMIPSLDRNLLFERISLETKQWLLYMKKAHLKRLSNKAKPPNGYFFLREIKKLEDECNNLRKIIFAPR